MPGILVCEARLISENPRNLRFRLFSIRPPAFAKRSAERVCFQVGSLRVFATDLGGELLPYQNEEFRVRAGTLTPLEQVQSATVNAAELFQMSDRIGQVKECFDADLLVVEGNPLESINVLRDPVQNFAVIMKGGKVFKNTLAA